MQQASVSGGSDTNPTPAFGFGLKVLLCAICFFAIISLTISMPILPIFAKYFHVHKDTAQQIASVLFLGSAFSGLIYGPLSDSFGRRRILLFTLGMYCIFAILSSLATSIEFFMLFQFFQGLHAGAGTVITLAIAKDSFQGAAAAKLISSLGLVIPIAPATGPLVGGYLETCYGWQSIYIFIATMVALIFSLVFFFLPETYKKENRKPFSPKLMLGTFFDVLGRKNFLKYGVVLALMHSCLMMYNITASFMFTQQLGVKLENFGFYQMLSTSGVIVGNLIINRFVMDYGLTKLLKFGSRVAFIAAILFLIVTLQDFNIPILFSLCMFIFCIGVGCIFSTAMPLGMSAVPDARGYTSSLMRLMQLTGSSVTTAIIAEFYNQTFIPMLVAFMIFATCIFLFGQRYLSNGED